MVESRRDHERNPPTPDEAARLQLLGQVLRLGRLQANLSVKQLAERAGLARDDLRLVELGRRRATKVTLERVVVAIIETAPGPADPAFVAQAKAGLAEIVGPAPLNVVHLAEVRSRLRGSGPPGVLRRASGT